MNTNTNTVEQWKAEQEQEKAIATGTQEFAIKLVRIVLRNGQKTGNQYFIDLYKESYHQPITNYDVQDLISTAILAIIEHSHDNFDIMIARTFSAINHEIWENRKPYNGSVLYMQDENNNLHNVTAEINTTIANSENIKNDDMRALLNSLTSRQKEVLRLLSHGYSYRQVAERLHIRSVATIAKHVGYIRGKAKVRESFDNSHCTPYVFPCIHPKTKDLQVAENMIDRFVP